MHPRFLESLVNNEHVVLGRRLDPYCFNHVLVLAIDNNGFYHGNVIPNWADLAMAVEICSSPVEKFLYPGRKSVFEVLRRAFGQYLWGWWIRRRFNLEKEFAKFLAYQEDFDQRPLFWQDENSEGKSMKAPWVFAIANLIEVHSNMRHEEIMTAPLGLMLWKSASIAELMGYSKSEIESEEETIARQTMAAMKEDDKEKEKTNEPD
jgi:hypothetical protein